VTSARRSFSVFKIVRDFLPLSVSFFNSTLNEFDFLFLVLLLTSGGRVYGGVKATWEAGAGVGGGG
jgi:hypothetical protein